MVVVALWCFDVSYRGVKKFNLLQVFIENFIITLNKGEYIFQIKWKLKHKKEI